MASIIKSSSVREARPGLSAPLRPRAARGCEKGVELLRHEDVVHAIQITCSCGEATVVELTYSEESHEVSA